MGLYGDINMKTTYPNKWTARALNSLEMIEGKFLLKNDKGDYGISQFDIRESISFYGSSVIPIDLNTLYWECVLCKQWNAIKDKSCHLCHAILEDNKNE